MHLRAAKELQTSPCNNSATIKHSPSDRAAAREQCAVRSHNSGLPGCIAPACCEHKMRDYDFLASCRGCVLAERCQGLHLKALQRYSEVAQIHSL